MRKLKSSLKRSCGSSSDESEPNLSCTSGDICQNSEEGLPGQVDKKRKIDSLDALLPLLLDDDSSFAFDYELFSGEDPTANLPVDCDLEFDVDDVPPLVELGAGGRPFGGYESLFDHVALTDELQHLGIVETVDRGQLRQIENIPRTAKSSFEVTIRQIPNWNVYFADQKERIPIYAEDNERFPVDVQVNSKISIWFGDITCLKTDLTVNSTTSRYAGENGVDRCVHAAAGERLKRTLSTARNLAVGDAIVTESFFLSSKFVIHTNGPCKENPVQLSSCYEKCMNIFQNTNLKSIAFPCISTGKKGYPKAEAARIALKTLRKCLRCDKHNKIERVVLCLYDEEDISIYLRLMQIYFPT